MSCRWAPPSGYREGVESRRLTIVRILRVQGLHRALVRGDAAAVIGGLVIFVQLADGRDVIALARRRRAGGESASDRGLAALEHRAAAHAGERIAPLRH